MADAAYSPPTTVRLIEEGKRLGKRLDTQRRIEHYRAAFDEIDINGDGKLDIWEIRRVYQVVGIAPKEDDLYALAKAADTSDDGAIDFEEFVNVLESSGRRAVQAGGELETLEAFTDIDKSGSIDANIVRQVVADFGLTVDVDELLSVLDANNSGLIDYEEFCLYLSGADDDDPRGSSAGGADGVRPGASGEAGRGAGTPNGDGPAAGAAPAAGFAPVATAPAGTWCGHAGAVPALDVNLEPDAAVRVPPLS